MKWGRGALLLSCVVLSQARGLGRRNPNKAIEAAMREADVEPIEPFDPQAAGKEAGVTKKGAFSAPTAQAGAVTAASVGPADQIDGSDKKFFKKDYPWDERPKANPLHFKHPYPAVQDSGDFDKDYVKDENSDDGYWKAQTTYDKLRQKVRNEKSDVEKALKRKTQDEEDLKNAYAKHEQDKKARKAAEEKAAREKARKAAKASAEAEAAEAKKDELKHGGAVGEGLQKEIEVKADDTKSAMKELEDCKKELKAAQDRLKELMGELEDAKKEQTATEATVEQAYAKEMQLEGSEESLKEQVKMESATYQDSREKYLKQKQVLAKLEVQIQVAAAKVQAMRDAEDKNGAVYPAGSTKSGAGAAGASLWSVAVVLCFLHFAA